MGDSTGTEIEHTRKGMPTTTCPHPDRPTAGRVCSHLLEQNGSNYLKRFTGDDLAHDLVCRTCTQEAETIDSKLVGGCSECLRSIEKEGCWDGIVGRPGIRIGTRNDLRFHHETIVLPGLEDVSILDVQPVEGSDGAWLACTATGSLVLIEPLHHSVREVAQVPQESLDFDGPFLRDTRSPWSKRPLCLLRISRSGNVAAVANTYGRRSVVLDLATGQKLIQLERGDRGNSTNKRCRSLANQPCEHQRHAHDRTKCGDVAAHQSRRQYLLPRLHDRFTPGTGNRAVGKETWFQQDVSA